MTSKMILTLALALALIPKSLIVQAQSAFQTIPRMRLIELNGELRVETRGEPRAEADQGLPYIRPGSIVRVLSGEAEFECSCHAVIRARRGDAFSFTAIDGERPGPGVVRIEALADGEEPSLNVNVGDKRFRIHGGGVVTVTGSDVGEAIVRAEGGNLMNPAVQVSQERALLAVSRAVLPGQTLVVKVSTGPEFANAPAPLSSLAMEGGEGASFEVWSLHPNENPQVSKEDRFASIVSGWPAFSLRTAKLLLNKYGLPDKISTEELVWNGNVPWRKTVVYRKGATGTGDIIRQFISCDIPRGKAANLEMMDIGLAIDRAHGELSAISDSEGSNFLAINLAIEVINGLKTPASARDSYFRTMALSAEGKSSLYTQGLLYPRP